MTLTRHGSRDNHLVEFAEGRRIAPMPAKPGRSGPGTGGNRNSSDRHRAHAVTCIYNWTRLTPESRIPHGRAATADRPG
jgi:hypothetical protein